MRWIWFCRYDNGAWDWKDSCSCRARSKKSYPTEKAAQKAGDQHFYRTGHDVSVSQKYRKKRT